MKEKYKETTVNTCCVLIFFFLFLFFLLFYKCFVFLFSQRKKHIYIKKGSMKRSFKYRHLRDGSSCPRQEFSSCIATRHSWTSDISLKYFVGIWIQNREIIARKLCFFYSGAHTIKYGKRKMLLQVWYIFFLSYRDDT